MLQVEVAAAVLVVVADEAIARTKKDQMDNLAEVENLHTIAAELHKSCDFTIKNYELRHSRTLSHTLLCKIKVTKYV